MSSWCFEDCDTEMRDETHGLVVDELRRSSALLRRFTVGLAIEAQKDMYT